jgi:polysaccharide export outer membrane protein
MFSIKLKNGVLCLSILWWGLVLLWVFLTLGCTTQKSQKSFDPWKREDGLLTSGKYRSVIVADLDRDGIKDIIGGGSTKGRELAIWYGNDQGGLHRPLFLPVIGEVRAIAVGDFNEDGLDDLVFSIQKESAGIKVWYHQFARRWSNDKSPTDIGLYEGIKTADINHDGHMDIIAANSDAAAKGGIRIWLGDGHGNWLLESGPTRTGRCMDVALADFDKDGALDLAGSDWGIDGTLKVWFGDGMGAWSSSAPLSQGSYYGLSTADVNGDGNIDILAGTYRQGAQLFLGDGRGKFTQTPALSSPQSFWKVLAVDLDQDGIMELLAGSIEDQGIGCWKKTGGNTWAVQTGIFPSAGTYYEITAADINNDRISDIFAASFGEGVKLWLGKGLLNTLFSEKITAAPPVPSVTDQLETTEENQVFTMVNGFPEYKIGPGDELAITMWKGAVGEKKEVLVRPDGKISFGFVENLSVTGLTPTNLDDLLTRKLEKYVKTPRLDVVVSKYDSKYVTLVGALIINPTRRSGPGKYELTGRHTVLEMIYKAGGPNPNANLKEVQVRRKNGRFFLVDLEKAVNLGDRSQEIILDDGDTIFIPTLALDAKRVFVFGEVEKPGAYTYTGSEMTLIDAIAKAGGPTIYAVPVSTKIVRGDITNPEIISADLKNLMEKGDQTQNLALFNGDLVFIPRSYIGDVALFAKRILPLLQLIAYPARIIRDYDYIMNLDQ